MQRREDFVNDRYITSARQRVNNNGSGLHRVLDEPKASKPKTLTPWKRFLQLLPAKALPSNWEHVIVNNSVDSITMPKWVASAILIAVLGFGVQSWWARSSDHDTMIEIRTELRLAKEANDKKDATVDGAVRDLNSWRGVMDGNIKEIKGMLSQQQLTALDRDQPRRSQTQQN